MKRSASPNLRSFEGPLTELLVRQPGDFGLGQVPAASNPDATSSSVCGFCSTGCLLKIHLRDGEAVNLTPDQSYPVNRGMACPKGWEALTPLASPDRGTSPAFRPRRDAPREPISWASAAEVFCRRMKEIQEQNGRESVAFLGTGQICTEELALLGAFAKFEMGVQHGDGNTRQCMATSVAAYKESFGFDAPPYTYADFEESDVLFLIGSNLCVAHPILWQRVLNNKRSPQIVVVDPRTTETAMQATQHVPLNPKSDLVLYYGLAYLLIARDLVNWEFIHARTTGFTGFAEHVKNFPPDRVAEITGIAVEELEKLSQLIATGGRVSFWWTMGVNQGHEATRTAQAIINLALMTGNIGRPGTGANSITGQCNAMGSRLFSNTTNLLGGHDFANAEHRRKVASTLGIEEEKIPTEPSWAYDQILDGIDSGAIKALWVVATNGAHSWIHQSRYRRLMEKLEFLVVQDIYPSTETADMADLFLPAAGWGEKEGTFINSERRIGVVRKVSRAPGEALSDFSILHLLAHEWGCGDWIARWKTPEDVFGMLQALSKGQPCDVSGIQGYADLAREGGVQWPAASRRDFEGQRERRLFEDGSFFTADARAKFVYEKVRDCPEPRGRQFPFELLTGRGSSSQWHTQTRTGKSEILKKLSPQKNYLEINPADAEDLGIQSGGLVAVRSRRGSCEVAVFVTPTVRRGQVFMPMHFEETNRLTLPEFDPYSRQPSYKSCAVSLERV